MGTCEHENKKGDTEKELCFHTYIDPHVLMHLGVCLLPTWFNIVGPLKVLDQKYLFRLSSLVA